MKFVTLLNTAFAWVFGSTVLRGALSLNVFLHMALAFPFSYLCMHRVLVHKWFFFLIFVQSYFLHHFLIFWVLKRKPKITILS